MRAATAQMRLERRDDRLARRMRLLVQQRMGREQHAGRAVATLQRAVVDEGLLQRVQPRARREALDRRDVLAGDAAERARQARTGLPATRTVQAPQAPMPQPYLAPVRPSSPRSTDSSGRPASADTVVGRPLTRKDTGAFMVAPGRDLSLGNRLVVAVRRGDWAGVLDGR